MTSRIGERPSDEESLAARAVRRRAGGRQAAAEDEVRRLLDVGLELMRSDPAGNPKVTDIVRLAGVSNDAFYRAFRGKNDLMAAIVDDGARRFASYVRHQRDKGTDPVDRIHRVVNAVMRQAADERVAATTRAVLRHSNRAPASHGAGYVQVQAAIADLLRGPLTGLGRSDPGRDALVAACAVFAVMEHFLWSERHPTATDIDHLASWVLRGVGGQLP